MSSSINPFWKNQKIKSKRYCSQLDQQKVALDKKHLELVNRKCIIFNQVNARSHVSLISRQKLLQHGWVVLISIYQTVYFWISLFQSLPGASMGDPTHDKVMRRDLTRQSESGLKGSSAWASTLKPKSFCLLSAILHSSDINRGYPQPPFSGKLT